MPPLIKAENGIPRRIRMDQQTWADGVTAATTEQINVKGKVVQIETTGVCADAVLTWTLAIASRDTTLFSAAGIAEGAAVLLSESNKGTPDADFNPFYLSGLTTLTFTPSGDPGASGATFDVVLTIV